jgi:probable HAF family extracellular repeat protein
LGGRDAESRDINDRGQVVGTARTPDRALHAFVADAAGMHDLNGLIPANSGWILSNARSINDRGQIVGLGIHGDQFRAFLLDPVSGQDSLRPVGDGTWVLHVTGTNQADSVSIVGLGPDNGGGDTMEVTLNGTTTTYGNIVGIVVDLGKGEDNVSFTGKWSAVSFVNIDLGAGDDTATLHDNSFAAPLQLAIDAGAGNDTIAVEDSVFANPKGLHALRIDTGAGNDAVSILCDSFHGPASLTIDLGAGANQLTSYMNTFEQEVQFTVQAGAGADAASILCNSFHGPASLTIDLGAGNDQFLMQGNMFGQLSLSLDAGSGDDIVTIKDNIFRPNPSGDGTVPVGRIGAQHFLVNGGAGNDHLAIGLELPEGHTGPLDVRLLGGTGNDDLSLFVTGDLSGIEKLLLLLDGGKGKDKAAASSNVIVVNVEALPDFGI